MKWNLEEKVKWTQEIINFEEKLIVAKKIASFVKDGDVIGFGSGSTSYLAVLEIAKRIKNENISIVAIPTSEEIRMVCSEEGIPTATINDFKPDWGFDGADEVSDRNWLIKGRGGAMFNEKIIMANSEKTYIIVDRTKFVNKLCDKFPIPVECFPGAYKSVVNSLRNLGASRYELRAAGKSKDGPVITENGNYIVDVWFEDVSENLEKKIKQIVGVIESGLFIGYNVEVVTM